MKKILIIIIAIIFLSGCSSNEKIEKVYLDDNLYGNSNYIKITKNELENLENSTYIIYTYNNYCSLKIPCEVIFKNVMDKYKISMYSISYDQFKETFLHNKVKYAPSVIIVDKGKILSYLDSNKKEDIDKYQVEYDFEKWLEKYIYLKKE